MAMIKVPAWQVKTTSSRGNVQKDLDYLLANAGGSAISWYYLATGGEKDIAPPYEFSKADVFRNALYQYQDSGAFSIAQNKILFPTGSELSAGEEIVVKIGYVVDSGNAVSNFSTPEEFGARGDGITDDTLAVQKAFDTRKDVEFSGTSTYLLTKPIIVHESVRRQTINGNNCTITWKDMTNSPFNFRTATGTVDTILRNKVVKNFRSNGPVTVRSRWVDVNKCNFLSFADSIVTNIRAIGYSNALRSFGNGYASYCYGDNLRNALWSCYDPGNNHIYFSSLGWSAGEGIVAKGDGVYVHGIHANLAGCLPKDSEDGEDAVRGVFMSTSADGFPAKNVYVSDISCDFFGAGALNLQGENVNVGGYVKMGSIWEDNYKPARSTSAIYLSLVNSQIGNIHLGTVHSGLGLNARCSNTSIGELTIAAKKQVNGTSILSAGDGPGGVLMSNVRVEGIQFYGQSTVNNDIYLNTSGISIGNIFISALNNQQGGDSVFISKNPHIERLYAKATNSASESNIVMITGDPLLEKVIIRRVFGTAVTVSALANPKIHSLYVMEKQGNTSPPVKVLGSTGTEERVFGDVQITGVSQNKPTLTGNLKMNSYQGPTWAKANPDYAASVSYPVSTTTVLAE